MAKDILKEAIADAKAVREVALSNAKAALEEAFTPRLQSMLSAKLSEELDEDLEENKEETNEYDDPHSSKEDIEFWKSQSEGTTNEVEESNDLDEEIDLEEILNELELEEAEDSEGKTVDEAKEDDTVDEAKHDEEVQEYQEGKEEDLDEEMNPIYKADDVQKGTTKAEYVHENKEFDLDALLEEINNLGENEGEEVEEEGKTNEVVGLAALGGFYLAGLSVITLMSTIGAMQPEERTEWGTRHPKLSKLVSTLGIAESIEEGSFEEGEKETLTPEDMDKMEAELAKTMGENTSHEEIAELKAALEVKTTELNEVNLLNSKLLYVNRIFKTNQLDEVQKLRVVESLDKAECIKEAKLIYETIKDTFNVAKSTKTTPKRSIREGLGMASKTSGTTQSVVRSKAVLNESNDMVARFKKLANITINQ